MRIERVMDDDASPGLSRRVYLHIRSNIWGITALFVALGGVAWADAQIGASDIQHNAIHSSHIRGGAVRNSDLGLGAVTAEKIADNAVGGAQVDESSLDRTALQSRISTACPAGQAIAGVTQNGTPTCTPTQQSHAVNACPTGQAISAVGEDGAPTCTPNLQSRIANGCPSGQAIAAVGENGAATCTANLQSRIANGCPSGQAMAAVGENGAATCTANLQSRIEAACTSNSAVNSVNENGTLNCVPVGAPGAARINFSRSNCTSGSPCVASLYSANGWSINAYCDANGFWGNLYITVDSSPAGGTTNFSWVQNQGGQPTDAVHGGFGGTGTITDFIFVDSSTGAAGTIILNSPARTVAIPFEMYGVTNGAKSSSYCETFGTATSA